MTNYLTLVPGAEARQSRQHEVFVFPANLWVRLEGFLTAGADGAEIVNQAVAEDGPRSVRTVLKVSESGDARKSAALFALAVAASRGDGRTKRAAYRALVVIARTGDELSRFVEYFGELTLGPPAAA